MTRIRIERYQSAPNSLFIPDSFLFVLIRFVCVAFLAAFEFIYSAIPQIYDRFFAPDAESDVSHFGGYNIERFFSGTLNFFDEDDQNTFCLTIEMLNRIRIGF